MAKLTGKPDGKPSKHNQSATKKAPLIKPARRQVIKDPIYRGEGFYNTDDIAQVKYEMLRRVVISGWPISKVVELFGVSRQSFYQTLAAFESQGMTGLMPKPRGRRRSSLQLPEQYY